MDAKMAGALTGLGVLLGAMGGVYITGDGLWPDPYPCGSIVQSGHVFWQSGHLDDEGTSEAVGDFKRAGWTADLGKNSDGWYVEAWCPEADDDA